MLRLDVVLVLGLMVKFRVKVSGRVRVKVMIKIRG